MAPAANAGRVSWQMGGFGPLYWGHQWRRGSQMPEPPTWIEMEATKATTIGMVR